MIESERGAALVEFALVSIVMYLLLAATVDFGRLMFSAQALQDVARIAAREMAIAPLPADITFDDLPGMPGSGALSYVDPASGVAPVKDRIFDPACLVVDLDTFADDDAIDTFFASMPLVNKALRQLMIMDHSGGRNLLRYPGALLTDASSATCVGHEATGFTVGIPRVVSRRDVTDPANGIETVDWIPVLEEIRPEPNCPARGPFGLTYDSAVDNCVGTPVPLPQRGLAAIRINYPYQAAMMTGFQADPLGPFEHNAGNAITADDDAVGDPTPPANSLADLDSTAIGPYAGRYGLGRQLAFAKTVRPFRKLIAGQAIYRREVFE